MHTKPMIPNTVAEFPLFTKSGASLAESNVFPVAVYAFGDRLLGTLWAGMRNDSLNNFVHALHQTEMIMELSSDNPTEQNMAQGMKRVIFSAMQMAMQNRFTSVFSYLLERNGGDFAVGNRAEDLCYTPFVHWAYSTGLKTKSAMFRETFEASNVNTADYAGRTLLHCAVLGEDLASAAYFKLHGTDLNLKDRYDLTALNYAEKKMEAIQSGTFKTTRLGYWQTMANLLH